MTNAGDALAAGTRLHELEIERVLGFGRFRDHVSGAGSFFFRHSDLWAERRGSRSTYMLVGLSFSTRQGRTRAWMKQVSCRGLALAQRSAFPWCRELVSELDRESCEHPVLRDRLVR